MNTRATTLHRILLTVSAFRFPVSGFILLCLASSALAQNATWTSNVSQTWSTGANWSNSSGPGGNATDRATFNTANGSANPNLTANANTGGISFTGGNFTVSADPSASLTLNGTGTGAASAIANSGGKIVVISAPVIFGASGDQSIYLAGSGDSLAISGDVTKSSGNLTLNSGIANTTFAINGNLTVSGGRVVVGGSGLAGQLITLSGNNQAASWDLNNAALVLNSANAIGSNGSSTINFNGGALVFTGNNTTDYSQRFNVSANKDYIVGNNNATAAVTLATALAGNGTSGFTVFGSGGKVVLGNSTNSFTGPVSVNGAGTLSVAGIGNTGNSSYLGQNGTINIGDSSSSTVGTLIYTGTGETSNKTINLPGRAASSAAGQIWNDGTGTLTFSSDFTAVGVGNRSLTLGGNGTGVIRGAIVENSHSTGNITTLAKVGSGTWTLSGNNTYTGATTVSNGTLSLNGSLTSNVTTSGTGVLTQSSDGVIAGTGVTFTQGSSRTSTLAGNNTYTGLTSINAGTLSVTGIGNSGSSSALGTNGTINIGSTTTGGTLIYTGTDETSNKTINLAGTTGSAWIQADNASGLLRLTSNLTATGSGNKTLTLQGNGTGEIAGAIGDSSGGNKTWLAKAGTGTWTLSGNNTYTGNTTVSNGTLAITGNNSAANGNTTVSGGTLSLAGTLTSNVTTSGTGVLTQGPSGVISGSGITFRQGSSGTSTLSGTNTYNGTTFLDAGTISISSDANLSGNSSALAFNGGTLQVTGTGLTSLNATRTTQFTLTKAIGFDIADANNTFTVSQVLNQGNGTLTKAGAGTLALTNNNTFTGGTTVTEGTLLIDVAATPGNSGSGAGNVTVAAGALGGTGIIRPGSANKIVVSSGAFLAPGDPAASSGIGTLTLDGGGTTGALLTLQGGAKLSFQIGSASDKINLWNYAGATDFVRNSNVIDITFLGEAAPGTYTLFNFYSNNGTTLTASGIGSGNSTLSVNFLYGGNGTLDYGTLGQINLVVSAVPEPATCALLVFSLTTVIVLRRRRD